MEYIIVIVASFLGALINGMTGIGFAVVYVSICSFVLTYMTSLVSMKFLGFLFIIPILMRYRSKIRWRFIFLPLLFSFIGNAGAVYLLKVLDESVLKTVLGVILLLTGLANQIFKKEWHFSGGKASCALVGVAMGFLGGICGMSGPVLALYFLGIDELVEDKDCYLATAVTLYQLMGIYQLFTMAVERTIPFDTFRFVLVGLIPTLVGMFTGLNSFEKANVAKIKLYLNCFMIAMGLFMFVSNLVKL